MVSTTLRPLSVGEILDVSFTLYRRHFATLGTVAVLCSGLPGAAEPLHRGLGRGASESAAHAGVLRGVHRAELDRHRRDRVRRLGELPGAAARRRAARSSGRRRCSAGSSSARCSSPSWSASASCSSWSPASCCSAACSWPFPRWCWSPGSSPTGALSRSWSLTRGSRWRMLGLLVTIVDPALRPDHRPRRDRRPWCSPPTGLRKPDARAHDAGGGRGDADAALSACSTAS